MKTKALLLSLSCVFFFLIVRAQRPEQRADKKLKWEATRTTDVPGKGSITFLSFSGAIYDVSKHNFPLYFEALKLSGPAASVIAQIKDASFEPLSDAEQAIVNAYDSRQKNLIGANIAVSAGVAYERKVPYALIRFIPIRKNTSTGKYERLVSFRIETEPVRASQARVSPARFYAPNSVLASGDWYKIGLVTDGIYKLSYSFLKNMGLPLSSIDPQTFKIYGNGGGMVPQANSVLRRDDLTENAIYVYDGGTPNVFDSTDYVLFYGQSPNRWTYSSQDAKFHHQLHLYSDSTYYFITYGGANGKRISAQPSSLLPVTDVINTFDDFQFHESDATNLIKSGREWVGEKFDILTSYTFPFSFPLPDLTKKIYVKTYVEGRGDSPTDFTMTDGSTSKIVQTPSTSTACYFCSYCMPAADSMYIIPSSNGSFSITVSKITSSPNIGWLNYVELNARRQLHFIGSQMQFRDTVSVGAGKIGKFILSNTVLDPNLKVWEVTDPTGVREQVTAPNGNNLEFVLPTDSLREFIAFNGISYLTPKASGTVPNQNLHASPQVDFVIISHPSFLSEANSVAALHAQEGLSVLVVTPQEIYNEYSSGAQDVSGIRDFIKMFYDRSTGPSDLIRYVLLFGGGSYDDKNRVAGNTNFIPSYQSQESCDPTLSYVSDDFYTLLDDNEGAWGSNALDLPDVGIGRYPVKSKSEAQTMLNKLVRYTSKPGTVNTQVTTCSQGDCSVFGDWRNTLCLIADDEDGNLHINDAEKLYSILDSNYRQYNIDKIYFDAYVQQATPGGNRYPDATDAINKRMAKGALIMNYTGHGGELGLAHERVVEISNILGWKNICRMPLFVTATCEFSRWDDPEQVSAGEDVILNADGGGIALLSTVRLVYAGPNAILNQNFYRVVFKPLNGEMPRLGDAFMLTKRNSGPIVNNRNFTLLGDPALRLAYPAQRVKTTFVNGNAVSATPDTIRALSQVTVTGIITDTLGNKLTNFNGVIYPTVFDKASMLTTLSNDGPLASPPKTFKLQKNVIYKGKASVTNGDFTFSFIVPKDIAYNFGNGKISYYAHNGTEDANGYYDNIIIGGSDTAAPNDLVGPEVKLFLNNDKFVYGGITDQNPYIYARVSDSSGMNTVGNGIGHDLTAVLDNNSSHPIVLNDYYEADMNSYKKGTITYPLSSLAEGTHTLKLKVWDVYNNSSSAYTEFVVASSAKLALSHVLNYPNPFTTRTSFYFEHNKPCGDLNVEIQVFTVSGKLVKTITGISHFDGYHSDPIAWDGKDDFGDQLARGVYVYRLKVKTSDGDIADKYERLVILK